MKALVFGDPPDQGETRPQPSDELEEKLLSVPFGLHDIDPPRRRRDDWVLTRPILSGVCGSDAKLILGDFGEGDIDNPMSAFSSIPHVPGHEVVCEVVEVGPAAKGVDVGQRAVLNPWLTCVPRGIEPVCPACRAGDLSLCWSFTTGDLGAGVHVGVATQAPGAFAELMAVHDSMLIPIPEGVSDELAVLADPFSVSLHPIVRHPPPTGGKVLVYGAGALGLTSIAVLRALYPDVEIAVVARFPKQAETAQRFGATLVLPHEPREELVEKLAEWSGGVLHQPLLGLPVTRPGGIDVVYDTIAKPETFEVGARLLRERGSLVYTGVAAPGRWEWTPVYFKELNIIGSNAFGIEEVEGVRKHAIAHYLDLTAAGRVDLSGMVSHRFPLSDWWDAVKALARPERSGALKVAFQPNAA